ncbi:ABC transporter substrate-binding protein [candidate division KSB3 bacterium]|uniref:ABC transporter substrate-binding protein n=1 Tax=candidate division KSB3 bacterium TaxID=2044937 RepID=A0A2G6E3X3_9BACT|nr:MAG: ABC transporter substrate-binding protein [candidate division KSB3 bacterium]PIE29333.1 MAG: ABC transporter substrate-binding protein [candidate division KSB3 bacterium]
MFKKMLPILLVVAMLLSFAGSALADAKKVYFIVKASESEFWQIVIDGGRMAAEELGVEFIDQAAPQESDVAKQVAILETAIGDKPDAIVLAPTVEDALVPGIEKAIDEGIPMIIIDSSANTDKYTSFLASDNVKIGELSADMMAEALTKRFGKPEGKVAALTFMSGVGSLEKRQKGFLDTIAAKYPGIEIVDVQDAQGKQGTSIAIVQNFITTYPDLNGIYCNNQITGDEAVRALDMAGKKDLALVAVDAGPQEVWGLENGFTDYIIVQKPWVMGHMGVEYALKAATGEKLDKFIDTGIVAISPEMMKSGEALEFLDPVKFYHEK